MQGLLGICIFIFIGFLFSENRKLIQWRKILSGVFLSFIIAFICSKVAFINNIFLSLNTLVLALASVSERATTFLFGYLAGGATPFEVTQPQNNMIIAFKVFPLILVISAISNILFYTGILPFIINQFSKVLRKTIKIPSIIAFSSSASIFLGTIETPLLIKPYLKNLSRAELLALMSATMSTIAGTVMVLYASVLSGVIENPIAHLVTASIISVPISVILSMIICPFSKSLQDKSINQTIKPYDSFSDALFQGIQDGLTMILQITATIIVLFAFIYLINDLIAWFSKDYSIEKILGHILRPFLWLTGISWAESQAASQLMGIKIILNEFVAFIKFQELGAGLSNNSKIITLYALCGFANLASFGIVVGGLGALLPDKKKLLATLGIKSLLIGNLATLMTAAIISLILKI